MPQTLRHTLSQRIATPEWQMRQVMSIPSIPCTRTREALTTFARPATLEWTTQRIASQPTTSPCSYHPAAPPATACSPASSGSARSKKNSGTYCGRAPATSPGKTSAHGWGATGRRLGGGGMGRWRRWLDSLRRLQFFIFAKVEATVALCARPHRQKVKNRNCS